MLLRRVDGNWSLWRSVAIVLIKLIALKEVKNGQEIQSAQEMFLCSVQCVHSR